MTDEPEIRHVNPKDLRLGPICHESLTDERNRSRPGQQ
jgi:hypothetical protein